MAISASTATHDVPAFLVGEEVALRPLVTEDADGPYPGWLNDEEVCRLNSHHIRPYTREEARDWIRAIPARGDLVLAITMRASGRHVGNVSLQHIDPVARSAEFAILIGDKSVWGKGVGGESAALVFRHGFDRMNLHRIHCGTAAENVAMRAIAESLGMSCEGVRREAAFYDGRYHDVVEYGLLTADYRRGSAR